MVLSLAKIVSGGQTGADMGALLAARELGLESGGVAPKGWLTEDGSQEALLRGFGLSECEENGYPARTRRNVMDSDGTLLVGSYRMGGTRLTYEIAMELRKPLFLVPYSDSPNAEDFRNWVERHAIQVLNVAGNRESQSPGITAFTRSFLILALGASPH